MEEKERPAGRERGAEARRSWTFGGLSFLVTLSVLALGARFGGIDVGPVGLVAASICVALVNTLAHGYFVGRAASDDRENVAGDRESRRDGPITDPVTRTFNRQGITINLLELMALAERYERRLAIVLIGVDHYEDFVEDFGPEAGDRVLEAVAETVGEAVRMPDRVGRYTGDSFLVVLPETEALGANRIAERIREAVSAAEIRVDARRKVQATVSVGITEFQTGEDLVQLIARAQAAMAQAKSQGHNRIIVHDAA